MHNRAKAGVGLLGLGFLARAAYKRYRASLQNLANTLGARNTPNLANRTKLLCKQYTEPRVLPTLAKKENMHEVLANSDVNFPGIKLSDFLQNPYTIVLEHSLKLQTNDFTLSSNEDAGIQVLTMMQAAAEKGAKLKDLISQLARVAREALYKAIRFYMRGLGMTVETSRKGSAWLTLPNVRGATARFSLEIKDQETTFVVNLWRLVNKGPLFGPDMSYEEVEMILSGDNLQMDETPTNQRGTKLTASDVYDVLFAILCHEESLTWYAVNSEIYPESTVYPRGNLPCIFAETHWSVKKSKCKRQSTYMQSTFH